MRRQGADPRFRVCPWHPRILSLQVQTSAQDFHTAAPKETS